MQRFFVQVLKLGASPPLYPHQSRWLIATDRDVLFLQQGGEETVSKNNLIVMGV